MGSKCHSYIIDGNPNYLSVTTWIDKTFKPFNADLTIDQIMASKNWEKSKYHGLTREEIKAIWEVNKTQAMKVGKELH